MNQEIFILDSTLRDGGYCNDWEFGFDNKKRIISKLVEANIEVVECGILCNGSFSKDKSKYSNIEQILEALPPHRGNTQFVALMNCGQFDLSKLEECREGGIDGIRVAFHKEDLGEALRLIEAIKEKKYKVFMQPMVTAAYSMEEYMDLLLAANRIEPYAFYIVDSFGSMKMNDVKKFCTLADNFLSKNIMLGFHSHNNLQLAYSNTQIFIHEVSERKVIVDCCIMGMGRGAGNLNTELFLEYMNGIYGDRYKVEPILYVIDEIINLFYHEKYWGYSLPNYLSASFNMHPNYASYLADKNTLTISMMKELLSLLDIEKKNTFDKEYIEDLYLSYMCANKAKSKARAELPELFHLKEILLIAPGKSIDTETDKINDFIKKKNVIKISINFNPLTIHTDYIFISNPRRYEEVGEIDETRLITTSNIEGSLNCKRVDYFSLLCNEKNIRDNAAMMLIKLMIKSGAKKIYLAGVDGYDEDNKNNYAKFSTTLVTSNEHRRNMNEGMTRVLNQLADEIEIEFVTTEKRIRRKKK